MLQTLRLPLIGEIYVPIRSRALLLFGGANFLFMCLDVVVAHSVNSFAPRIELVPIVFTLAAGGLCFYLTLKRVPSVLDDLLFSLIMLGGVLVAITGFLLHLQSKLPSQMSQGTLMEVLAFGAPLVAPLSIAGVSLVSLLGAVEERAETGRPLFLPRFGSWLVAHDIRVLNGLLVLGLIGNFFLSLEHAQSEFHVWLQWIPIGVAAWTGGVALLFGWTDRPSQGVQRLLAASFLIAIATGFLGFSFHLQGCLPLKDEHALEQLLYRIPLFAPLLFSDLGLLGLLRFLKNANTKEVV